MYITLHCKMFTHFLQDNQLSDQIVINTLTMLLSIPNAMGPSRDVTFEENSFAGTWCNKKFSRPFLSAYAFLANLLTEIVCPEVLPILPWPDEDFLKYTIERQRHLKCLTLSTLIAYNFHNHKWLHIQKNLLFHLHSLRKYAVLKIYQSCWPCQGCAILHNASNF